MSFTYLYIFLQSNLLEVPFYHFFFRKNQKVKDAILLTTAINSLTHPIVFLVIMNFKNTYLENILLAEIFAIVAESIFFSKVLCRGWGRSILAATIANLVSWQIAPMITYFLFK